MKLQIFVKQKYNALFAETERKANKERMVRRCFIVFSLQTVKKEKSGISVNVIKDECCP